MQSQQQSIADHLEPNPVHEEPHIKTGEYLKSLVFGGLDGLVNTLSVVIGGFGSGASIHSIMTVGVSVVIGDGIGMALGDYISSKKREREVWQVDHRIENEKGELRQIYRKHYSEQDTNRLVDLIAQNKQAFVNVMMVEELGLTPEQGSPLLNGVVTLVAFVLFGFLPLLPYVIEKGDQFDHTSLMYIALVIGGVCLFVLGFSKAWLIGSNRPLSGTVTLFFGGVCVAVGYGVGLGIGAA